MREQAEEIESSTVRRNKTPVSTEYMSRFRKDLIKVIVQSSDGSHEFFAIGEGLLPEDPRLTRFSTVANLKTGLLIGMMALLAGLALLVESINLWRLHNFGRLDYAETMRWVIPGVTLTVLGVQTVLNSFFGSILGTRRR